MNIENKINLTIETIPFGNIVMEIPYVKNNEFEHSEEDFVISIPKSNFCGYTYTNIDLSNIVKHDIEHFNMLNKNSDENHQIYIDTLCVYGIKITGNHIRIEYWFHQDGNKNSHRMCAGVLTHCNLYREPKDENLFKFYPEGYSPDVCVYW